MRVTTLRFLIVIFAPLGVFGISWLVFWLEHKPGNFYFFDPQDAFRENTENRRFPLSAQNATFEPFLKHYIGVTQLLITVAAASIAFGGNSQNGSPAIAIAKTILAWSILYGVFFCALLLWRYDEYSQNIKSYTLRWYAIVSALGSSTLICFIIGYFFWSYGLLK
jgi:hypothetical protein